MRKTEIWAKDRKAGMTPAEIRRAVHDVPDTAKVTVVTTWRGGVRSMTIQSEGETHES